MLIVIVFLLALWVSLGSLLAFLNHVTQLPNGRQLTPFTFDQGFYEILQGELLGSLPPFLSSSSLLVSFHSLFLMHFSEGNSGTTKDVSVSVFEWHACVYVCMFTYALRHSGRKHGYCWSLPSTLFEAEVFVIYYYMHLASRPTSFWGFSSFFSSLFS